MELGTSIFDSLKQILDSLVVKFGYEALSNETENSMLNGDYYRMAVEKTDTFNMYKSYNPKVIMAANITTSNTLIEQYVKDPTTIPKEFRERVLEANRNYTIENFVEENKYYRGLMGLPALDDIDFVYVDQAVAIEHNISSTTPIHELDEFSIIVLQSIGYVDTLIEKYPKKKYLKFLGPKKIDILLARGSQNFGLLRVPTTVDKVMYETFVETYNKARNYFGRNIFNKGFAKKYPLYEGFVGMCLLVAALQQIVSFSYKNIIYREFFDAATIKAFFDSYNMPYFKAIPLERQRILVKNINKLLHYKSTNKVIYDLCSILGYESMDIYQYYLVKKHNLDEFGNPMYPTKELEDGTTVPDYDNMYSLFFQPVDLKDDNPTLSFTDASSRIPYEDMTITDPYWYDDEETRNEIFESDFNYTETKYIGMQAMYRLTKMIFEVTHFYRMIQDNKKYTSLIMMDMPKLFGDEMFSFFDSLLFSMVLISKRMGYNGEIVDTPTKIMSILGFDFKKDYATIRAIISDSKYTMAREKDILNYISRKPLINATDINGLYVNIRDLHNYLKNEIASTRDVHEHRALKKFYKAVLVMNDTNEMYRLRNGELAPTITDYLEESSPMLAKFIKDITDDEEGNSVLNSALTHVISRFEAFLPDLQYLFIITGDDSSMMNALIELIRFFKSYTVDLAGYAIVYLLDDRDDQMVKILDEMKSISASIGLDDYHYSILMTNYLSILAKLSVKDSVIYDDKKTQHLATFYQEETIKFLEELKILVNQNIEDYSFDVLTTDYIHILSNVKVQDTIENKLKLIDMYIHYYKEDTINIKDTLTLMSMFMEVTPDIKDIVLHDALFIEALLTPEAEKQSLTYLFDSVINDKLKDSFYTKDKFSQILSELYSEEYLLKLREEYKQLSTKMDIETRNKLVHKVTHDIFFYLKQDPTVDVRIKSFIKDVEYSDKVHVYDYNVTESLFKVDDSSFITRDKLYKD